MKKLITILCLLLISLPVFSAPNYKPGCNDNLQMYDNSEIQEYYNKLVDDYDKKYHIQIDETHGLCTAPINAYNREVIMPLYEFIGEQQRKGKTQTRQFPKH